MYCRLMQLARAAPEDQTWMKCAQISERWCKWTKRPIETGWEYHVPAMISIAVVFCPMVFAASSDLIRVQNVKEIVSMTA